MERYQYWLFVFSAILVSASTNVIYPFLLWDPRNPFFQDNHAMNVLPNSRINIFCPNPTLVPAKIQHYIPHKQLFENLWIVDKASYDQCVVDTTKSTDRLVMKCNNPSNFKYELMVFQQFNATPGGLTFQPGQSYYFIGTSDGTQSSLGWISGGHCTSHNMKMAVYVCIDSSDPKCQVAAPNPPRPVMLPQYKGIPVRTSCIAHLRAGVTKTGIYPIDPDGLGQFDILCDQTTSGGGWEVFQRRFDGSVNFRRGWNEYRDGFGSLNGEFWLGLQKIHRLTFQSPAEMRVDLEAPDGETRFAEYSGFEVEDSVSKYKLTAGTYSAGDAGDAMALSDGAKFSTVDQDNDKWHQHCAKFFNGAWWHGVCHKAGLNGIYRNGSHPGYFGNGIIWETWKGYTYSLSKTEMKIKP